jgi:hypothetical protein
MPRKFANTAADPTLAKTPIVLDGETYNLCFDYRALAEAEAAFQREGYTANLLVSLYTFTLENLQLVLPSALRKLHPQIGWVQAQQMVTLATAPVIANAIAEAWLAAQPKPKEEEPPAHGNPHGPSAEKTAG